MRAEHTGVMGREREVADLVIASTLPGEGPAAAPRRRRIPAWEAIVSVVVVLALLELAGRTGLLSRDSFPLVSDILGRLASDLVDAHTWRSIADTLSQALTGLAIGTLIAVPLGMLFGLVPLVELAARPIVEFLRPIPSIAILPLVILLVGVGFQGAVVLTSISSLWLVLVMSVRGAKAVDPVAHQTMLAYGIPRAARLWRLVLPSALPFIATGVRIAASVSLIVAITAELLGGMPGLGKDVQASLQNADKVGMYSFTFLAGMLGLAVNFALVPVENRLLAWHVSRRGVQS